MRDIAIARPLSTTSLALLLLWAISLIARGHYNDEEQGNAEEKREIFEKTAIYSGSKRILQRRTAVQDEPKAREAALRKRLID